MFICVLIAALIGLVAFFSSHLIRSSGDRRFMKWKKEDMENAEWMPVIFLDDDGGIVWNYSSVEKFISHMEIIEKIYSFKLMN